jgi:hypothetical protein
MKVRIDMNVEEQWNEWLKENPESSYREISDEEMKQRIVEDLSYVSQMNVAEYTLYLKWSELSRKYPIHTINTLFGEQTQIKDFEQEKRLLALENNIWIPEKPEDYLNLKPTLIFTDNSSEEEFFDLNGNTSLKKKEKDKELSTRWNDLRNMIHTMRNYSNIGRNLHFIVADQITGKYLGVVCITSDFMDLGARDKYIGWSNEVKTTGGMLNHTAICSSISPTQPFGYNYVGGKLLALLCLSDTVQNAWKNRYGQTLVGLSTTSLYGKTKSGGLSQYDNLKHWQKLGYSAGSIVFETKRETEYMIRDWLKKHHTRKYFEWYHATLENGQPYKREHRNRSFAFTYNRLGIPKEIIKSEHQRGIYFSPLYNNTNEFLRKEITEDKLVKSFDTSEEYLVELWKNKYARQRINSLVKNDRVSNETLFYKDLITMNWEEAKERYLSQVGR